MRFYTSVHQRGKNILLRGYENGQRVHRLVRYQPYVFLPTPPGQVGTHRTLEGRSVTRRDFDGIGAARKFMEAHAAADGFTVYGLTNWTYLFIHDEYPGTIEYDPELIRTCSLDIEVLAEDAFPDPQFAMYPISSIAMTCRGQKMALGTKPYEPREGEEYTLCSDEEDMLRQFLSIWNDMDFDIVTGWNIEDFDIPYLINRLERVCGEGACNGLSPWGEVRSRPNQNGREVYDIVGLAVLDYIAVYKKFNFKNQESYRLDYIASIELGEKKLDYSMHKTLGRLYRDDHQRYIEYNIHDADLVERLEARKGFIAMMFAFAYDAKVQFVDTMATVKPWDIIIHNYLLDECNTVIPPQPKPPLKVPDLVGGYVKEPQTGLYEYVVGLDVRSEYPHAIMQWNISPETRHDRLGTPPASVSVYDADPVPQLKKLQRLVIDENLIIAPNGCTFRKDRKGFLPALMERMFQDRKRYQGLMREARARGDIKQGAIYDNMQLAKKIQLNAGYGALANIYFRWFSFDLAESITSSGRLTIRWVERHVNEFMNRMVGTKDADYVLAIDTDSVYINMGPLVRRAKVTERDAAVRACDEFCKRGLMPMIKACLEELASQVRAPENRMVMNRETIADKGLWTAAKHYILNVVDEEGRRIDPPTQKMKGVEAIKSSTPQICREKIKRAIFLMLNAPQEELEEHIEKFRAEFMASPFHVIASPRSVNNLIVYSDEGSIYRKGTPLQVKGALLHNHLVRKYGLENDYPLIHGGDKIRFCYLKEGNPTLCNVIAATQDLPREFGLEPYLDHEVQFEKTFEGILRHLAGIAGMRLGANRESAMDALFA